MKCAPRFKSRKNLCASLLRSSKKVCAPFLSAPALYKNKFFIVLIKICVSGSNSVVDGGIVAVMTVVTMLAVV